MTAHVDDLVSQIGALENQILAANVKESEVIAHRESSREDLAAMAGG